MNRRFAVLLASALLALSACGSGKFITSRPSSAKSATSTSSAVVSGSAESVRVGSETEVFSTSLPADPAEARVVEDFRKAQILWEESDTAQYLVASVTAYVTGDALVHLRAGVTATKAQDLVPTGTDRMFKTRVTALSARSATVSTCDDGSNFREKNRRTGRIDKQFTASPDQEYMFETWRMVQLSGHWAITAFSLASLPAPAAQPCQP
jgi:hypothetical protein